MITVSCPGCGAEVRFRSHAAVMAVCEYCHTGVLKDADAVRDLGKVAAVLEDYSPIQLNTAGTWGTRPFTVIGRLQLRYDAGFWNEWYLLFDDGGTGWLGDASGQFTITQVLDGGGPLPAFDELVVGGEYTVAGERWVAADVRTARCTGGQGELPFKVGDGWQAKVADLRLGSRFVTLDYSDDAADGTPALYTGVAVQLEELRPQLLRDDMEIQRTAGRFRGNVSALDCPSCGSPIKYLPGMTANLVCPSCHAQLDAASPKVEVLRAGERVAAFKSTLPLGAEGKLGNQAFTVIGVMRRADDEGGEWTEYLLYGTRAGFTWLVETDDGWQRADVLDAWPQMRGDAAVAGGVSYPRAYTYPARVTFAAGAFNWRVQVGDTTRVDEFKQGWTALAAERTETELTWSRSSQVAYDQLQSWFPKELAQAAQPRATGRLTVTRRRRTAAKGMIIALVVLNAIPLMFNFGGTFAFTVLGGLALYLPAVFLDNSEDQ